MVGDPYDAEDDDPDCYPGTSVLINIRDLRDQIELNSYEVEAVGRRSLEPPPPGNFDPAHYRALHRHLFQDVYAWAGEYRTRRTSKGGNVFCYPEWIDQEVAKLFKTLDGEAFVPGADVEAFVKAAADFLGELNAIHPFRDGNGRSQLYFLRLLGLRAGHPFRSEAVERDAFLHAIIESYHGRLDALVDEFERMLA
jgi:cell filamentation protein